MDDQVRMHITMAAWKIARVTLDRDLWEELWHKWMKVVLIQSSRSIKRNLN